MDEIEQLVYESSQWTAVRRRAARVRGDDGHLLPASNVDALALLVVQPAGGSTLARALAGDGVTGAVSVWSSVTALGLAYLESDNAKTPLGWATLQCAPADGSEGPPGDLITWQGRRFEVTAIEVHDADGLLPAAGIRRYVAVERKVSP